MRVLFTRASTSFSAEFLGQQMGNMPYRFQPILSGAFLLASGYVPTAVFMSVPISPTLRTRL